VSGFFETYRGAAHQGTLFLEAFGRLSRTIALEQSVDGQADLYSLFSARAQLMSWSTTPGKSSSPQVAGPPEREVLWRMNEAELTAGASAPRIGWVQVGLEGGIEPGTALPPLIQCFEDALHHFGEFELAGLQVTTSDLQPARVSSAWNLVAGLNWFNPAGQARTHALVAFDDGLLQAQPASDLAAALQGMGGRRFDFGPCVTVPQESSIEVPAEMPYVVLSPGQPGVSVTLPEWTASAAAWVLAIVIDTTRAARPDVSNFAVRLSKVEGSTPDATRT
jgi:hypothetical protein